MNNQEFRFIKDISPEEVFSTWESAEGQMGSWQKVAREKGWDSWRDWRWYCFQSIKGDEREWKLDEILDPNESVPKFKIGPTQSWQKHFGEKNVHTFQDLIDQQGEWVEANDGVQRYLKDFPFEASMIALSFSHNDQLTLFEGHHRCAAITLAKYMKKPIQFKKPLKVMVAQMKEGDEIFIDEFLRRGTTKPDA